MIAFKVSDMTCGHCVSTITKALKATDAQAKVEIDLTNRRVQVKPVSADASQLADAIREAGGGKQILDGERGVEAEAVDARNGDPLPQQPRDEERGERAAVADEDEDVLRTHAAAGATFERGAFGEPSGDLASDLVGEQAGGVIDPAFLIFVVIVVVDCGNRWPDRDRPAATDMDAVVRRGRVRQAQACRGEVLQQLVD